MEFAEIKEFPWKVDGMSSSSPFVPLRDATRGRRKPFSGDRAVETNLSNTRQGRTRTGWRKVSRGNAPVRRVTIDESVYPITQTGVGDSLLEQEPSGQRVFIREMDGGVRLATGPSGYREEESAKVRVLPPSYSQCGR